MTKKHFEAIAKLAREIRESDADECAQGAVDGFVDGFCELFKAENPNFNEARFREACQ